MVFPSFWWCVAGSLSVCVGLFLRLQNLSYILAEVYGSDDSGPTNRDGVTLPDMSSLRRALKVGHTHTGRMRILLLPECIIPC